MNKRLIISFFLAITIVMPSFYPATWIDSRTGGKKKGFPYSECEHVWIDKLNYSEYQQLKMRIRDSFPQIDGLGNPVLGKQEELMEEQGLSNVPGAERVKDKFIMTENGKLLLYDVEKKQVVSPSEACHLSNVIVDGPASYALRTDETIYCTEDKDCGNGMSFKEVHPGMAVNIPYPGGEVNIPITPTTEEDTSGEVEEKLLDLASKAQDITGVVNALYNNDTDTFGNIINSDDEIRKWFKEGLSRASKEHDFDEVMKDVSVLSDSEKRLIVQYITSQVKGVLKEDLKSTGKPLNRIRSNYIEIALLGPDRLDILVPIHLMKFIDWLSTWHTFDQVYTAVAVGGMIGPAIINALGKGAGKEGTEIAAKNAAKAGEKGAQTAGRLERFIDWWKKVLRYNRNVNAYLDLKFDEAVRAQKALENLPAEKRLYRVVTEGGEKYIDAATGAEYKILKFEEGSFTFEKISGKGAKELTVSGLEEFEKIPTKGTWWERAVQTPVLSRLRTPAGAVERVNGEKRILEKIIKKGKSVEKLEEANKLRVGVLGKHMNEVKLLKEKGIIDLSDNKIKIIGNLETAEKLVDPKTGKKLVSPETIDAIKGWVETSEEINKLNGEIGENVIEFNRLYGEQGVRISSVSDAASRLEDIGHAEKYWSATGWGAIRVAWGLGRREGVAFAGRQFLLRVGGRLLRFMATFSRLSHIGMTISLFAVSKYNRYFQKPYFPAVVKVVTLSKELRENISKEVKDEEDRQVYAQTEIHSTWINQNVGHQAGSDPLGAIVGLLSTSYTPSAPNFPEEGLAKGKSLGKHIYIVDQVNPNSGNIDLKKSDFKNMVIPLGNLNGLFYFFSDYNGLATYTLYEDPASWTPLKNGMYTGIYWYTKNADISEIIDKQLAPDLTKEGLAMIANLAYPLSKIAYEGGAYASIPVALMPVPISYRGGAIAGYFLYSYVTGKVTEITTMGFQDMRRGVIVDTKFAYSHKGETCQHIIGDREGAIAGWKWAATATLALSIVTNWAPEVGAAAGPVGYAAGVAIDLTANLINAGVEMQAIEAQRKAIEDMSSCLETDIEIASLGRVIEGEDIAKDFSDMPKEMGQAFSSMTNWLEGLSPEASQLIKDWTGGNAQIQILHDHITTYPGEMHLIADRVYDAYFQKADIRWLVDPSCPISFCYQEPRTGAYKCMMSAGYFLLDENGNPILEEPNPMFLSLGVDSDNGYMYMASKVIEIEKNKESKVDPILELYPDGIKTTDKGDGPCLKKRLMSSDMLALENVGDENYVNEQLHDAMGAMDYIQTEKAIIWPVPEENGVKVRFVKGMPPEGCGMNFMGVATFPNATLEFKNDRQGTITLKDDDGNKICDFALGSSGAIVYMRGFIRPGVVQRMGNETYNFSGVYHMFLTGYLAGMSHSLNPEYGPFSGAPSIENCTLPDGTPGYKFVWKFHSPDSDEAKQWQDKAETMCITDGIGDNNNMFGTIIDNKTGQPVISYTYVNEYGDKVTDQYPVQGWKDQTPYDNKPGYEITLPDGSTGYAVMTTDSQGNPQLVITDANGQVIRSLPLALLNSPNGGYHFGDGKVSLSNDFYFPLNPQFVSEGMNGAAFMKPGKPPWGAPSVKPSEERGIKKEQPFLSLPSVPPGAAGIVFAFLVILSLALTREYARKRKKG